MSKKPTLTDALAKKTEVVPAAVPPAAEAKPPRLTDQRVNMTVRIEPEKQERLKILAARRRKRVNDLMLEAIDHFLEVNERAQAA